MALTNYMKQLLQAREEEHNPINVAIVGSGWFGSGLVYEIRKWVGMEVRVLFSRRPNVGIEVYTNAGKPADKIVVVNNKDDLHTNIIAKNFVVCTNFELIDFIDGIDVVFEATGNVLVGAKIALSVLNQKIHFVTTSAEMDATVGYMIDKIAEKNGVIFSNADGDQPGHIARMISEVKLMGFEIAAAGNGKGFLNYHTIPEDIMQFVRPGDSPDKITSFTDGSKQALELATLANGCDLTVDIRGMHGVKTTKDTMVDDIMSQVRNEGVVEYFMGTDNNYGMTVFVIGKREEDPQKTFDDLKYLKRGDGPYYLFFRDYHLCYFEAPTSIAEAVLFGTSTIHATSLKADVIAVAKRDLKSGERLDGIGGYTAYGLIDTYENSIDGNFLPLGLAEFAEITCDIPIDTPITYDMVSFSEDNLLLDLRSQQDKLFVESRS